MAGGQGRNGEQRGRGQVRYGLSRCVSDELLQFSVSQLVLPPPRSGFVQRPHSDAGRPQAPLGAAATARSCRARAAAAWTRRAWPSAGSSPGLPCEARSATTASGAGASWPRSKRRHRRAPQRTAAGPGHPRQRGHRSDRAQHTAWARSSSYSTRGRWPPCGGGPALRRLTGPPVPARERSHQPARTTVEVMLGRELLRTEIGELPGVSEDPPR